MSRWARGEAEIDQMLSDGQLQRVTGAGADEATQAIASASAIIAAAGKLLEPFGLF